MRFIIRAIALIAPVFVAAALGVAQHAGVLHKDHITQAEAVGCIAVFFAAGLVLLSATRKKDAGKVQQQRQWQPGFYFGRYPEQGRRRSGR